ncbi:MAG: hypothetical protein ACRDX8_10610 [Acidimicrobiales bacterium]
MEPPDAVIEFGSDTPGEVLGWLGQLESSHQGWINLQPGVPEGVLERSPTPMSLFHRRPRELTLGTWAAGPIRRRGPEPATVGILHGRPERVRVILTNAGLAIPAGWRVRSDRPAVGLVARVAEGTPGAEVLAWLLKAVEAVSPVPVVGTWRAVVQRGRQPSTKEGDQ